MSLPAEIIHLLRERGETLSVCESLTAGLASATLASVPGASAVLRGGLITYATELKAMLAGVSAELLADVGPIHPDTAAAMARGARQICDSTWAISFTGVAGPSSQDGHPVGEVYVAVAGPSGEERVDRARRKGAMRFALSPNSKEPIAVMMGSRAEIRAWTVEAGLRLLRECVASREQN